MLIHLVIPEIGEDDFDYSHYKLLGVCTIENATDFLGFIKQFKNTEAPIQYDNQWYLLLEYSFKFPKDSDCLPLLCLYVCEYC